MPWDDTSLWVADVAADGSVAGQRQVRSCMLRQIPSIYEHQNYSACVVLPAWRWHAALHPVAYCAARVAALTAEKNPAACITWHCHALDDACLMRTRVCWVPGGGLQRRGREQNGVFRLTPTS